MSEYNYNNNNNNNNNNNDDDDDDDNKEYMKRIGVNLRLDVIQKTAVLGTAKLLRKVLSM